MTTQAEKVMDQFAILKNKSENKSTKKKDYTDKYYEWRVEKQYMLSDLYKELNKSPMMTYQYLWAHIVRAPMTSLPVDVYGEYFIKQQKLACGYTRDYIARELSISPNTVHNHVDKVVEAGLVRVDSLKGEGYKTHNVYILGYYRIVNDKRIETLYFDDIFS